MARSTMLAILCVAVAGCGGGCSGSTDEEPGRASATAGRTEASGGETGEVAAAPPVADPGPPPEVRVSADVHHDRQVTARIANHGDEARLAGTLTLERQAGEGFEPVDVRLDLRFSCEDEAPECVTLAAGAVFIPPPWLGTIGDAQCACEECGDAEAGTYRFVVRSCGGAHAVPSEPFTLP